MGTLQLKTHEQNLQHLGTTRWPREAIEAYSRPQASPIPMRISDALAGRPVGIQQVPARGVLKPRLPEPDFPQPDAIDWRIALFSSLVCFVLVGLLFIGCVLLGVFAGPRH